MRARIGVMCGLGALALLPTAYFQSWAATAVRSLDLLTCQSQPLCGATYFSGEIVRSPGNAVSGGPENWLLNLRMDGGECLHVQVLSTNVEGGVRMMLLPPDSNLLHLGSQVFTAACPQGCPMIQLPGVRPGFHTLAVWSTSPYLKAGSFKIAIARYQRTDPATQCLNPTGSP